MKKLLYIGMGLLAVAGLLFQFQKIARSTIKSDGSAQAAPMDESSGFNLMTDSQQIGVPGEFAKAFTVAYAAFLKDSEIPKEKKKIENYDIGLSQTADHYIVLFAPRRKPDEPRRLGGSTALGKAVNFKIRKSDYQIIERLFYR